MNQATLIKPLHTYSKEELLAIGRKLNRLTQDNDHTEALLVIAKFLNHKRFIRIFEGIKMCHDAEGFIPEPLNSYRYESSKSMEAHGRKLLGADYQRYIYNNL